MKVLIISANAFSKIYNNGKTLEALFRSFKPSELSQLFTRPQDSAYTDYDFCENYYSVSEMDIINKLRGKSKSCGGAVLEKSKHYESQVYKKLKNTKIKHWGLLRDALWKLNLWKTRQLDEWIENQNADIVFLVGGGSGYLHELGYYISTKFSIPLCVFYTDDYLLHPVFNGLIGKLRRVLLIKHYKNIIAHASGCFAIGDMMSQEYGEYFGKDFFSIMNSLPYEDYKEYDLTRPRILSYFGGLHLNRWRMICRLALCLPKEWELQVYSASEISDEIATNFIESNVKFLGCIQGNDLKDKMKNSTALLHVESDDYYNRALTHLSVSTKIPEYLMSGRLVIGFGPQEVASMRLITDNGIGVGIDSSLGTEQIKNRLNDALSDLSQIISMGRKAHEFAIHKYDGVKNSIHFRRQIENIINNNN